MLALTGTTNRDFTLAARVKTSTRTDGLDLQHGEERIAVPTVRRPDPGSKVTAVEIPDSVYRLAARCSLGGGAFNSMMALRAILPAAPVRYLDTSCGDRELAARLRGNGLEFRFLGLQPIARNLILGADGDKIVVRQPLGTARELGTEKADAEAMAWLLESPSVLVNSVKDARLMKRLTAASCRLRLHLVLTPSLSAEQVASVLPTAISICASLDELETEAGIRVEQSLRGAAAAIAELRRRNAHAAIFITMGKDGVVSSTAGSPRLHHLKLGGRAAKEVARIASRTPARVCGCGDAFAAGVYAFLEEQASLLAGPVYPFWDGALAAVAGCCSALHWMGFRHRLTAADFDRNDIALPVSLRHVA